METYDKTFNQDEQIKVVLNYNNVRKFVKCELFMTTLRREAMMWYKNFKRNSVDSWDELHHEFTVHFTTSKTQPKMIVSLEAVIQGKNESLQDYIERFNKEVVQVQRADEKMKTYLIEKGLWLGIDFKKVVQIDEPRSLNELMKVAKTQIKYEEKLYVDNLEKMRKDDPQVESSKRPV